MIAPASGQLALYLGITSPVILAMSTSVFVLGYGRFLKVAEKVLLTYDCN